VSLRTDYDAWHQHVYESDPGHEDASSPWYDLVRQTIGPVAGLQILEVACGRGGFVREIARAGASIAGCDFSLSALRVAKSRLSQNGLNKLGGQLAQGDVQKLPFADASFDIVISCETIEHVPDAQSALDEMYRVARPSGRLFLTTPNYLNFMGLYEVYAVLRHPHRKDDQPFDRLQLFPQIRRFIRRAGWVISYSDGTVHQFPFIPGRNPLAFPRLEANRTVRRLLSPFAYHYFVIARKPSAT
jgi:ubiquinone/menaquinone biosynthesis C-methylase UbiE